MSRHQEYKHRIRVGYQESNDGLRITIPDKIRFPADLVHIHFRDQHTLVLAQDRTEATTHTLQLSRNQVQIKGCRYFVIPGIKGIGDYFGITPTKYVSEGPNLIVSIPDISDRRAPKRRKPKQTKINLPIVAKVIEDNDAEPKADVLIDMHGKDFEFSVPFGVIMECVLEWTRKGY